jgi:maleate isomerase
MFGWRARIGLISPATSGVHTSALEMEMLAPEGVLFVSRFLDGPRSLGLDDLRAMLPQVAPAARAIAATPDVDLILAAGAPIVLANGSDTIIRTIADATGLPATTNVASIVAGLRRLGVGRVAVVTPYYPDEIVELVRAYLEAEAIEIVSVLGGSGVDFGSHKDVSPQQTYRNAKRAFLASDGAEALVIVGGGAPLHEVIGVLEQDIGAPVVANNFAALWNALAMAHVREPIEGYGSLLTCV